MSLRVVFIALFQVVSLEVSSPLGIAGEATMRMATHSLEFRGSARGGTLVLGKYNSPSFSPVVSIETAAGESAESVAARLAAAAASGLSRRVSSAGASIILPGFKDDGVFYVSGTEVGLGIPDPPRSVSGRYDREKDRVVLTWRPPQGGCELQLISCMGAGMATVPGSASNWEQANVSERTHTRRMISNLNYAVIALAGSARSAAAGIRIPADGLQEETQDFAFRAGVAPNWTAWGNAAPREATRRMTDRSPVQKTRYQVIAGSGAAFDGGVYREFLGLEPGKTYKVSVRVNTLEMDKVEGEWSYAVYAAPNGLGDAPLTEDQLAGRAPLPSGARADECARIVEYTRAAHTDAEWVKVSTADASLPGKTTGNITLPPGVTALTVWLRHKGRGVVSTGVGMDWIALEELPR